MLRVVVLDDEIFVLEVIEVFVLRMFELDFKVVFLKIWEVSQYLIEYLVDFLFLDINMLVIFGLDFVCFIDQNIIVIFIILYMEYVIESYEFDVVDYLFKFFVF